MGGGGGGSVCVVCRCTLVAGCSKWLLAECDRVLVDILVVVRHHGEHDGRHAHQRRKQEKLVRL